MESTYVLAIGESLIDAVSTSFVADLSEAREITLKPGGSPANFCRFLHSLGSRAKIVAALGKDGLANIILKDMEAKGIDHSCVKQVPEQPTTLILVGKSKGTPDFIPYRGADQYIEKIPDELIAGSTIVHTTSFALSREPAQTNILHAMQKARALGKQISIDWNYSEKIWGGENNSKNVFDALMTMSPLLKISLDDAERFFGKALSESDAKNLLGKYPTTLSCLTCGAGGVWYTSDHGNWVHASALPVEVKDSTGAGDSFWAGFIHAYLREYTMSDCINNALSTAALRLVGKLS